MCVCECECECECVWVCVWVTFGTYPALFHRLQLLPGEFPLLFAQWLEEGVRRLRMFGVCEMAMHGVGTHHFLLAEDNVTLTCDAVECGNWAYDVAAQRD